MSESEYGPVQITVPYDGDHVDIRVLVAIGEVIKRGIRDGMTGGGYRRVAAFISSCAGEYSTPPTQEAETK